MRQLKHIILLLCLTTFCPKTVMAQIVPRDIPTIEAYINDHKKQRSLLLARATLKRAMPFAQGQQGYPSGIQGHQP